MNYLAKQEDTICAIITPPGTGGINVIRISGSKSLITLQKIFKPFPTKVESHRAYFGNIIGEDGKIDEVLATCFLDGRSFTGEDCVEISCHGNQSISNLIMQLLIKNGVRVAERGEFSFRAFLNGKLDLVQAESIVSLINSKSKSAMKLSLLQLEGQLSQVINRFEEELLYLLATIEASIDFATEGIETISYSDINQRLMSLNQGIQSVIRTYSDGKKINQGVDVVLAGAPNVGKSSVYNLLLDDEKAIVTDVAGTTRDILQSELFVKGININLYDTAGIRIADNIVEKIGVEKSKDKVKEALIVLFVKDAVSNLTPEEKEILAQIPPENLVFVLNKVDLVKDLNSVLENLETQGVGKKYIIPISTFNKNYREILLNKIADHIRFDNENDSAIVFQARHYEKLNSALNGIEQAQQLSQQKASVEFISLELRSAMLNIQEILGKHYDDQILDKIFSQFCIGK